MQDEPQGLPSDPPGVLVIRPGDTLLVVTRGPLTMAAADAYRGRIMAQAPGLADVLVVEAEQVAVYRSEPVMDPHPWREYNSHGNTCHHPGCDKTEEEHAAWTR
jgi:hypothetical protein